MSHSGNTSTGWDENGWDLKAWTTLDRNVHSSRNAKYKNSEQEVSDWIFTTLSIPQNERDQYKQHGNDLIDTLKDGYILCRLGDLLGLPNCPTRKYKRSRMPFVQMENILFFLKACEMVGVAHDEIFQTIDLFERKDPYQVIVTLMSFSRQANEVNGKAFREIIGPKVVKGKPPAPRKPI